MKVRKKPVVVDAIQLIDFSTETVKNVLEFMGQEVGNDFITQEKFFEYCIHLEKQGYLVIHTLEGDVKASKGGYIIKGVKGEFYPCDHDIFKETYDIIEE